MKPFFTLPELADLISDQKNGIADTTRRLRHRTLDKELWRLVAGARSNGKDVNGIDFKEKAFHKLHERTTYDEIPIVI